MFLELFLIGKCLKPEKHKKFFSQGVAQVKERYYLCSPLRKDRKKISFLSVSLKILQQGKSAKVCGKKCPLFAKKFIDTEWRGKEKERKREADSLK